MRMMIKKLLKKHKYPPEGMNDAVQTVMTQCELWSDNYDFLSEEKVYELKKPDEYEAQLAADENDKYDK